MESQRLVDEIKQAADKLLRDKADLGDIKLLSRSLRELRYSFKLFSQYRDRRKVSVFGSARTPPESPVYQHAVAFGQAIAEAGFMVVTGAGPGIMEAGHVGAGAEMSIGVNILLPFEQDANDVIAADEKLVHLRYFFTRKLLFIKETDALVCFPGGFGTLDEGFEGLTLLQTGKCEMMPLVLVDAPGGEYWEHWREYIEKRLFREGMISEEDFHLFKITHSVEEAVREIVDFYRVYHSMRYVRGQLVFRLNHPIEDALFARIEEEYSDILLGGKFHRSGPHQDEHNDPHAVSLPRLWIPFNRRSHGRLRQLIDLINREAHPETSGSQTV
ncbi:MAG: TIGR00730 family Rossman fold protein [Planctomycetota bacterium]